MLQRTPLIKWRDNPRNGKNICKSLSNKRLASRIYEYIQLDKKTNNSRTWRHVSKEDIANRHVKRCSATLGIRKMKTGAMRYRFAPNGRMKRDKGHNECWQGCRKTGTPHCWWDCKMGRHLCKGVWQSLEMLNIELI